MDIDANVIGRNAYTLLRANKVIPDKDKKDLTLTERKSVLKTVGNLMANLLANENETNKDNSNYFFYIKI